MGNIWHSWDHMFEVNCGPQLEVIVSDTTKWEIQEETKALAHVAVDISDKGMASINLGVRSMTVKI
jgi:hypothetical protein